jgi:D-alanyl-D-alanine carboxypeptidase
MQRVSIHSCVVAALLLVVSFGRAQTIAQQIDTILAGSAVSNNTWTIDIENDLGTVAYYQKNPTTTKAPASNCKIFTTSGAFGLLGTNHWFESRVYRNGTLVNGTLTGDLNLVTEHDITWNDITFGTGGARKPLDRIATQLKALGLTNVVGNVQVYGVCIYNYADTADTRDTANQATYNAEGATAFVAALNAQGITVSGSALGQTGFTAPGALMYTHKSTDLTYGGKPLRLDVACIPLAKNSANAMADELLRHIGYKISGTDSFAAGATQVFSWLSTNVGLSTADMVMQDGSGLSHSDRFSAREIVTLVRFMATHYVSWPTILPIGCVDGTISSRFCGTDGASQVHAKTGSLSISIALSGYIDNKYDNHRYYFSFIGNNSAGIDQTSTRNAIDSCVVLMAARGVPISPQLWAVTNSGNNSITVSWTDEGFVHTGYKIYSSSDGLNFGPSTTLGASTLKYVDTGLQPGTKRYYRVTVISSSGGESPFSKVYGAKVSSNPPILVVDDNDRWRFLLTDNPQATNHAFAAIAEQNISGPAFDTAYHLALDSGTVKLTNYPNVVWLCGGQSTQDRTFTSTLQPLVTTFQNGGGNLFVSGSEIGWDLDRDSGPATADRNFYHNQLRSAFNGNAHDDAGTYNFAAVASGIFVGDTGGFFDDGTYFYNVAFPDVLTPTNGSIAAINYVGGIGGAAAITYDGTPTSGKLVNWGFPFESITNSTLRDMYMSDVLRFFNLLSPPTLLPTTLNADNTITLNWTATAGIKYRVQYTTDLSSGIWNNLSPDVTATSSTASKSDTIDVTPQYYRVLLLN